jgi:hypothetical protein
MCDLQPGRFALLNEPPSYTCAPLHASQTMFIKIWTVQTTNYILMIQTIMNYLPCSHDTAEPDHSKQ